MKKNVFFLLLIFLFFTGKSFGQASTNGGSGLALNYPSLADAITALNAATITSNVIIWLDANETAPAGGYVITQLGGNAGATIIIDGNNYSVTASAAHTIGSLHDAIFEIQGGDYITIQDFIMQEHSATPVYTAASNNMTEWGIAVLKASVTDGAKYITLQGNTLSLDRLYQNSFGIYSNVRHSSTAITTNNDVTNISGATENLIIYSNNISNVNNGIVIVGSTTGAYMNTNIDIGGNDWSTGNTISNYGLTGSFSGYISVSGSVMGINVNNSLGVNISHNIIACPGLNTAGTVYGIYLQVSGTLPTSGGPYANSVDYNNISVKSGNATGTIYGILNAVGNSIISYSVNNNDFNNFGHTGAGSGTIYALSSTGGANVQNINNNSFTDLNVNTTGSVYLISYNATLPLSNSTQNVNNNKIFTAFAKTGAGGTVYCMYTNASSVAGSTKTIAFNEFYHITLTGATALIGFQDTDGGAPVKNIHHNILTMVTGGTGAVTGFTFNYGTANFYNNLVSLVSTGGAFTGMSCGGGSTTLQNVYRNEVIAITSSGASSMYGIQSLASGTSAVSNVYQNKICNMVGNNASSIVYGLYLTAGTTINAYNNMVSDLNTPNANAAIPLAGIYISGGSTVNLFHNSVYLNASSTGALFGSAALYASTTPTLDSRNNILYNSSVPSGAGFTSAYRRTGTALGTYSINSNANCYWAGDPESGSIPIFYDGTTAYNFAGFQALVGPTRDAVSFRENAPLNLTMPSCIDLHMQTTVPTLCESGGIAVTTPFPVNVDFDDDPRAPVPDVGADEFNGIAGGVINPSLIASAANSQEINLNFTLNPDNDSIVIVWNATGSFAPPVGAPPGEGNALAGGLVVYQGKTSPKLHTGLIYNTPYYYKAFSWNGTMYSSGVTASATPLVAPPVAFTATAVSYDQISLAWTKNASGHDILVAVNSTNSFGQPDNGYAYTVNENLPTAGTVIYVGPAAGYNHTPLSPNTQYYYKAWSMDSYTYYSTTGLTANAKTYCAPTPIPWSENFDGVTIPALPSCWFKENGDWVTTNNTSSTNDADARSGTQFLREAWTAVNEFVWTPGFALTQGVSYDFSFWWAGDNYAGWTGDVFVNSVQGSAGATQLPPSFVVAGTTTTKTYVKEKYTFVPQQSNIYYFAIRVNASSVPYYLSFDDFSLEQTPSCEAPTNLSVSNISNSGAQINWNVPGGFMVDSFFDIFFEVDLPGNPPPEPETVPTEGEISDPSFTWAGGQPNTNYSAYVRTDCGFTNPKVDNFWMAMSAPGILEPTFSGGTSNDPGETGIWYEYNQSPIPWWNIWFYNDPLDTAKIKKIRMGFWVQPFNPGFPGNLNYVINWSSDTWQGPGFPTPMDEAYIVRSPVNGPMPIQGLQWIEIYYTIYDYNPEWISVDIWGDNILIEQYPMSPPMESPLLQYWNPSMNGGLIVHECLPKSSLSAWAGPVNFTTTLCDIADQCNYTFRLTDSYGDGWNGNTMAVKQGGNTIQTLSLDTGFGPVDVPVALCDGLPFELFWNAGGTYPAEVGVEIFDAFNNSIYNKPPGQGTQNTLLYTGTVVCTAPPCQAPTNLQASNISSSGAKVSWDLPGGYQVDSFFDIFFEVDIPGNPAPGPETVPTAVGISDPSYTWSGGQSNTSYKAFVRTDCGFTNPTVDNFWLAMSAPGILEPTLSGGTANDPDETGQWYLYDQAPMQPWWNIWFYNDPLDTAKIKKIRMGFWVLPLNSGLPGNINYVINWSSDTWQGPGFPTPADEAYIVRSPVSGPIPVQGLQWIEIYYTIYDYNPEWISVDIWGDNILIEQYPMAPPIGSPLLQYWTPLMPGGIIVHECLPKSSLSAWAGPVSFTTLCDVITAPFTEDFEVIPPPCWTVSSNPANYNWAISTSASGYGVGSNSAICNFYSFPVGTQSNLFSPDFSTASLTYPIVKFDYAYATYTTEVDQLQVYASSDYGQTFSPVPFVTMLGGPDGPLNTGGIVSTSFIPNTQQWRTAEFLLPPNTNKLAFVGLSAFGNNLYIDNVSVQEAPPCSDYLFAEDAEICEGETYTWRGNDYDETGTYYDSLVTIYPPGCDSVYVLNLTVTPLPDPAGPISGPATVTEGTNGVIYTVPPIVGITRYEWDFDGYGVLISGTGSSVTLDFAIGATSGQLSVRGENDCGFGAESFFDITVLVIPSCDPPTNLQVVSVTSNSAVLDWTGGSMWNVEVGLPDFDPGSDPFDGIIAGDAITDKPWTATGLQPFTDYEFYVQKDCGFMNPKVDNFWMAMSAPGMLEPSLSGGTANDPGETGIWYQYNQTPQQPWWNIWFYNDPPDTNRLKKIRMGFWVSPLMPGMPSTIFYVFNWSTPDWDPPIGGFPMPQEEIFIERSPTNGPIVVDQPMWVELYYVIEDYNPEWISVDIWGENIIIEQMPSPPPFTSPLMQWWNPGMMGGIIVHECLPKTSISEWEGPEPFKTCQDYLIVINAEICDDELPYAWEGQQLTQGGNYQVTYPTTNPPGCDSTIILNLTVHPTYLFVTDAAICEGDTYTWRGNDYTTAGQYTEAYLSQFGCDSMYVLNLVVHPTYEFVTDAEICEGETYTWRGNDYTTAGTYTEAYQTQYGCDSVYILNLLVHPVYEFVTDAVICDGETYSWRGNDYTAAGTYREEYLTQFGCDSVYVLNLTVHPAYLFVEDVSVYDNQLPYLWHGGSYWASGTYYANYLTQYGCDSIYQLNLTVKPYVPLSVTKHIGRAVQAEWYAISGATMYQLRYKKTTETTWIYVTQSTQLRRKIVPLEENTDYNLELRYKVGTVWYPWNSGYPAIVFNSGAVSFTSSQDIGTKFIIEWTDLDDVSSYVLQYRKVPSTTWSTKGYYTSYSAVMGSMEEGTAYEYRVCPRYAEVSFEWTHPETITSQYITIQVSGYDGYSASFFWGHPVNPQPSGYYLQVREVGSTTNHASLFTSGTTETVTGLDPLKSYEYRLVVQYNNVSWGTTTWRPLANNKEETTVILPQNSLNVYPNPFSDVLTLEISSTGESMHVWNLYDANGKLVMSGKVTLTPGMNYFEIDGSGLPCGLYLMQSAFNGMSQTSRILKQ